MFGFSPSPEYPERFVLDFLPVISWKIGRSGFQMFHIRYWDPLQMPPLPTLRSFFSELLRSFECTVIFGSRISELEHDTLRQLKKATAPRN
jgi:hypothetical protein